MTACDSSSSVTAILSWLRDLSGRTHRKKRERKNQKKIRRRENTENIQKRDRVREREREYMERIYREYKIRRVYKKERDSIWSRRGRERERE